MADLIETLASFSGDPLGFVYFAFPWGEGELAPSPEIPEPGPESWQILLLQDLGAGLLSVDEAIQIARTSGHGIGKSALVSWIILWAISTFPDTKGVVTANTENQLKTKTWAELAKWFRLFIANELFEMTATAIFSRDPAHAKTWRIDMVPWSERNTEAFAGLHNQGNRILVLFDEASAIPDVIWETTEGALTDKNTQIIWAVFGNPTRNKGRFRDCFSGGRFAHRWRHAAVDSREVRFTNKEQIARWIKDYGEDSDFVRIRVLGKFPRVDAVSFISWEAATAASVRSLPEMEGLANPVILGVDVARFGDDSSCIYYRAGRDGRSVPPVILHGLDTMQLASRVSQMYQHYNAQIVVVDGGGVGGGVVDRLRMLQLNVWEVDFSSNPDGFNLRETNVKYANKRAEIWGAMREWLERGCIPELLPAQELSLVDELTAPTYSLNGKEEIQLESKRDMRKRGVPSPNVADALALTFAAPLYELPRTDVFGNLADRNQPQVAADYDPFSRKYMEA